MNEEVLKNRLEKFGQNFSSKRSENFLVTRDQVNTSTYYYQGPTRDQVNTSTFYQKPIRGLPGTKVAGDERMEGTLAN